MEDIPRDVHKELENYKVSKKARESGHWTLLFVGDQGEVITIRKFKGLVLLALFIMVAVLSAAVSIYMLYKRPFEENRRLKGELVKTARQIKMLGDERDLLLTRLGIAESRLKKPPAPEPVAEPVDPAVLEAPTPANGEQAPGGAVAAALEVGTERAEPVVAQTPKVIAPPADQTAVKSEVKVDVRDFQVRHEPEQKLLHVQFRLKNVNVEAGAVSGRTFVVLANDREDTADILTYPSVTLVDGKPGRIHLGRYFSISRFNIVKFKRMYNAAPRPFNHATVFVYSGAGDLLLEKHFLIENPFKATAADEPQTAGEKNDTRENSGPATTILEAKEPS